MLTFGESVMKSREILRAVLCMLTKCGGYSSSAAFFSIQSIFEVYNEGARETILMQQ